MLCTVQLLSHYYFEKIVTLYTYIYLCNEHTTHRDVKASRPKFGLVISGLSLWTLSPRSQAFGLGLKI